ncbi:MAG: hypothetical protein AAF674_02405 [Pseudomonadota bacterium]
MSDDKKPESVSDDDLDAVQGAGAQIRGRGKPNGSSLFTMDGSTEEIATDQQGRKILENGAGKIIDMGDGDLI